MTSSMYLILFFFKISTGLALAREGGIVQQLYFPFFFGLGGPIGCGKQWFPWIHAEDVANLIQFSIENDHVHGVLNAVAPQSATNLEFTKAFGKAMWRPAFLPLPPFVLNAVFGAERGKTMAEGQKVIPKRTLEMGYKFLYPDLLEACKDCARLRP
jgi:hypothetical protein